MDETSIQISYQEWGQRWPEIVAYAERREITLGQALVELIDKGLSHQ